MIISTSIIHRQQNVFQYQTILNCIDQQEFVAHRLENEQARKAWTGEMKA